MKILLLWFMLLSACSLGIAASKASNNFEVGIFVALGVFAALAAVVTRHSNTR